MRTRVSRARLLVVSAGVLSGCQTYAPSGADLSPMQKRMITSELIDGSFDDTYRAVMTVFQDQDYSIRNTDMDAGLIVAHVARPSSAEKSTTGTLVGDLFELLSGAALAEGTGFELSCIVDRVNDTTSEVRLSIHATVYTGANMNGVRRERAEQVYDPGVFQNFFNQILIEVKRRQAIRSATGIPATF